MNEFLQFSIGSLRVEKTLQVLRKTDVAVVVTDASRKLNGVEEDLLHALRERGVPYVIAYNKSDLATDVPAETANVLAVSAVTGFNR